MNIPSGELQAAGSNIAAVITEEFLNDFSAAHHKDVPSIYVGTKLITDFDNDIGISWDFQSPIEFSLNPIPSNKFKRLWLRHLQCRSPQPIPASKLATVPANLGIQANNVAFTVTCYQGHSTTVVTKLNFTWNLTGACAVTLANGNLTLQPITVQIQESAPKEIERLIKKELMRVAKQHEKSFGGTCGQLGNPNDDSWCTNAETFILFLINTILASDMRNFVASWALPNAIQLFDNITVQPNHLAIHDSMLILGGIIGTTPTGVSPAQTRIDGYIDEFKSRLELEFKEKTDNEVKKWRAEKSPAIKWLKQTKAELLTTADMKGRLQKPIKRALANATLALLSDGVLFDTLAKKYLNVNKSWNGSAGIDHIVQAQAGWWFAVENASGAVVPNGINIGAHVAIGGSLALCYFDLDPKHFGSWACNGISVQLTALPNPPGVFSFNAYPTFASDGIYVGVGIQTAAVGLDVPGWPSWANDILEWVTGVLTLPLYEAICIVVSLIEIKVLKYPADFPGTAIPWTPNMTPAPTNSGPYLVFSAAPAFN